MSLVSGAVFKTVSGSGANKREAVKRWSNSSRKEIEPIKNATLLSGLMAGTINNPWVIKFARLPHEKQVPFLKQAEAFYASDEKRLNYITDMSKEERADSLFLFATTLFEKKWMEIEFQLRMEATEKAWDYE